MDNKKVGVVNIARGEGYTFSMAEKILNTIQYDIEEYQRINSSSNLNIFFDKTVNTFEKKFPSYEDIRAKKDEGMSALYIEVQVFEEMGGYLANFIKEEKDDGEILYRIAMSEACFDEMRRCFYDNFNTSISDAEEMFLDKELKFYTIIEICEDEYQFGLAMENGGNFYTLRGIKGISYGK